MLYYCQCELVRFLRRRGNARHRPRASGRCAFVEFFDNLSCFAGVSEALAERDPAGEILTLSLPKGKDLP